MPRAALCFRKAVSLAACVWLMALAPHQALKPALSFSASPSGHMLPVQDDDSLYGDMDDDGDDGDGLCNDGMQTLPFADDLDVFPVSDTSDAACDEPQVPFAI
ncbi:MAG: hypothetical protein H6924_04075 [Alphaproteobacteria bacterium]|nr:hypothetical protein [Alphaproteobacteria bacterium]